MAGSASKSATQNSISDELFEIVYLWQINYLWVRSLYMKLMGFQYHEYLDAKDAHDKNFSTTNVALSSQIWCYSIFENLADCTVHRDFIRGVTAFQRNIFIFLFSTFQNLHLFAVILLVQSSMHLYESPSKLVAKLKLIEWVHSSNIQQRRLCSDEGKPCYKVCFTNNASAISELFTNSHLSEILS